MATPTKTIRAEAARVKEPFELFEMLLSRSATASSMPRFNAASNPLCEWTHGLGKTAESGTGEGRRLEKGGRIDGERERPACEQLLMNMSI